MRDRKRPRSGRVAVLVAVTLLAPLAAGCGPDPPPERIVLIVVDTLRRDHLSPYGSKLLTPNVKRLAETGQVFENAVASFHQTTMSMGAFFTGRTPSIEATGSTDGLPWTSQTWCGLARFAEPGDRACLPAGLPTLAEQMREAGYWTAGVVSNRLLFRPAGFDRGFDTWMEVGSDCVDLPSEQLASVRTAPRVHEALGKVLDAVPREHLFLYVHYVDVHDWKILDRGYAEAVEAMDVEIGELLELLEDRELLENAVVVLTSDHGEALGEKHALKTTKTHIGNPSYQTVLEIPLIVWPPFFENTDRMIRTQDLGDLLGQIAGRPPRTAPADIDGDEVFLTELRFLTYRKGRWKSMFHRKRRGMWALFDLESDPGETVNLISARPDLATKLLQRVGELSEALASDPLEDATLSEEDAARLRALGYLDDAEAAAREDEREAAAE